MASEQTAESVVSVLHLPSDEMKGRIIGREGRNIRAFESVTGVNLIIDDTPGGGPALLLRPGAARDRPADPGEAGPGRPDPPAPDRGGLRPARTRSSGLCRRAGEDALVEVGITDMHPELVTLLGRLRYRTAYGQNVLKHLLETAHIAGIMAAELGLDRR